MPPISMNDFRHLFTERDVLTITAKVRFVVHDAAFVAEDDDGGRYSYGEEGFPDPPPRIRTIEWFGVSPRPESEMPDPPLKLE
jgi:hypothetical protein